MSSNETKNTPAPQKPKWLTAALVLSLVLILGAGVFLLRSKKSSNPNPEQASQSNPADPHSNQAMQPSTAPNPSNAESTATNNSAGPPSADAPSAYTSSADGQAVAVPVPGVAPATGVAASLTNTKTGIGAQALSKAQPPTTGALPGVPAIAPIGSLPLKTNGLNSAPSTTTAEQTPPPPAEGCLTLSYHHKKTAGHSSEESCLNHKNLIKLKHTNANSVCVRLNKTPVAFEKVPGKADEILVAPGAGPHAEITVRYCFGKKTCPEDCTVPKDEFMGSIGASAQNEKTAQWDPSEKADPSKPKLNVHAKIDSDLKKDLETLDEPDSASLSTFKDWVADAENPACGTNQAMR